MHQSLIQRVEGVAGEPRYVMLETVHEYALERLRDERRGERLRRRHANYLLAFAGEVGQRMQSPDQSIRLDRLEAERANFRTAFAYLSVAGDHKAQMELASSYGRCGLPRPPA